jgi:hypothetical protein
MKVIDDEVVRGCQRSGLLTGVEQACSSRGYDIGNGSPAGIELEARETQTQQ